MSIRRTIAIALLAAAPPAVAQTAGAPLPSEFSERESVRRVPWPVRFEPREPGGCDGLGPDDVEVREDGLVVEVDVVERRRLPTVHAVVIDNSASMDVRLGAAKKAALAYLERLPEGEPAMLATFSDNLILRAPLTADRSRFARAVEEIETRSATALHDAFHYTIEYLASRPERKLLVWISDGCDSVSLSRHSFEEAIRRAGEIRDLTVFPIGIDLPARCGGLLLTPGYLDGPVYPLQRLASSSGGTLYRTKGGAALDMVFDEILERVRAEGFVAYRPPAHGEGPRDRPGEARARRVRVRSQREDRCRIESSGPRTRLERPPEADAAGLSEAVSTELRVEPGRLLGTHDDLDRERSLLYSATAYHLNGRLIADDDRKERFVEREFRVDVPPFSWVRERLTSTDTLLFYLLQSDEVPFLPLDEPEGRRDLARRRFGVGWIHGQSLLELRDAIGRGLFAFDGYREFAYERAGVEYRDEMRRVLETSPEVLALSGERRRELEALIAEQRPEPRPARLQNYLAEWLGDIAAYDLVVGFEGWIANTVLDERTPGSTVTALFDLVDEKWARLGEWFPPPTQVRVVTPLVPTYDAAHERVGFWRIVLPDVMYAGPPTNGVPDNPLGLTFLRHLIALTGERTTFADVRVDGLSYATPERATRRRMMRGARERKLLKRETNWRDVRFVRLDLESASGDASLSCSVAWDPEPARPDLPPEPLCVDFGDSGPRPADPWTRTLRDTILDVAPQCEPARLD